MLFSGFIGMLSSVIIVIPLFVLDRVTSSWYASIANPNTSNPGPRFAVDDGAFTVIFKVTSFLPLHPN